jgi:hypothetical protein
MVRYSKVGFVTSLNFGKGIDGAISVGISGNCGTLWDRFDLDSYGMTIYSVKKLLRSYEVDSGQGIQSLSTGT